MNSLATTLIAATTRALEEFAQLVADKYNLPRNEIIDLWNAGVDPSLKVLELLPKTRAAAKTRAKTEDTDSLPQCGYEFKKGKQAGSKCTAKVCEDSEFCRKHNKKDDKETSPKDAEKKPVKEKAAPKAKKVAEKKEVETPVVKAITSTKASLQLNKNQYGNYEHKETHLIFDKVTKKVIGKQVGANLVDLTAEDIDTCKKLSFMYVLPTTITSSTNDSVEDEDDAVEEDDEEEDEVVEEDEDE